jgi:hypothetical protein
MASSREWKGCSPSDISTSEIPRLQMSERRPYPAGLRETNPGNYARFRRKHLQFSCSSMQHHDIKRLLRLQDVRTADRTLPAVRKSNPIEFAGVHAKVSFLCPQYGDYVVGEGEDTALI